MTAFLLLVMVITAVAAGVLIAATVQRVWRAVPIFAVAVIVGIALSVAVALRVTA